MTKSILLPLAPIEETPLYTKSGIQVAYNYKRIVRGGRGEYIEFIKDQLLTDSFSIPENQKWRLLPSWKDKIFYVEFRTIKDNVMVYHQVKTVSYADYVPGLWYISPWDLFTKDSVPTATGDAPKWKL